VKAKEMWESYLRRTGGVEMYTQEPGYRLQYDWMRDLLTHLEVILEDEEIAPEKRERILRSVIYGAPTVAEAEQRLRQQKEALERAMTEMPPWRMPLS
jgi:hypothetical protein